jgi:hypothetical protein
MDSGFTKSMCLAIRLNCPPETELTAHRQKEEASV